MKKHFSKIWFILGESRQKLPLLLVFLAISSITETFGIGLLGPFFAIATDPSKIQSIGFLKTIYQAFSLGSEEAFITLLGCFIVIVFGVKAILYFFSKYYILRFSHMHSRSVVSRLYKSYLYSHYNFFVQKNSADLTKNIMVETQQFHHSVLIPLLYSISNISILILLIVLMASSNLPFLLVTMAALLPVLIFVNAMKGKLEKWGKIFSQSQQQVIQTLNHGLGSLKETRIIGCEPYFEKQMAENTYLASHMISLLQSFGMLPRILIEASLVVFIVSYISISQMWFGANSESLIASMSIFAVAAIRLLPAASQVSNMFGSLQSAKYSVNVLYEDLKESDRQLNPLSQHSALSPNKHVDISHKKHPIQETLKETLSFENHIQLHSTSYRYSENLEPAINGISLNIKKGESVALIGKSGAGKTTLVDLILGLLSPQTGDITVDGVSIYDHLRGWQNLLGYIPQSIFLLDDTIERNIAFGVPDHLIDHKKLSEVIASAQLAEWIDQLPDGLNARVGERGVMLSGGQRQRIGIARALYHEREILILDEATSALDNETEQRVSEAISFLAGQKTIIMIAHRLSTVKHCDRVFLLERGTVVKSGSYAEVVESQEANT